MDFLKQDVAFGKHGFNVSRFGMGCMRLPKKIGPGGKESLDEAESVRMIRYAVEHGVNYFDTAYGYGGSEVILGRALKDGFRSRVEIATKLPSWLIKSRADFDRYLAEELERLQVEQIDVYMVHALRKPWWDSLRKQKLFDFLAAAKRQGRIRYAGFSFHDDLSLFKEIVNSYDWDACMIQLNYLDDRTQAGVEGLRYAGKKGLPVVIMEPLKGGALARNLPEDAKQLIASAGRGMNPVRLAFRWLCSMPETTVILSGVNSMAELREDIEVFAGMKGGPLDRKEKALVGKVRESVLRRVKVGCTGCGYCMPCPAGVAIPDVMKVYNDVFILDDMNRGKVFYEVFASGGKGGDRCLDCGKCEKKCPQKIEIRAELAKAHTLLRPAVTAGK